MPDPASSVLQANTSTHKQADPGRAIVSNRQIIVVWRVLIIIVSLTGVVTGSKSIGDFLAKLLYFTIQSNLILVACIGYAVWATLRNIAGPSPLLKGAATVYISITALVYNLILARALAGSPLPAGSIVVPIIGGTLSNDLVHIIAPLMAVLDWLLFDVHGRLHWRYPVRWLAYPLAYLAFVLIRGLFVHGPFVYPNLHYPYPFLNVDKIGYSGVALNTLIYGFAFWLIGLAFVVLDRTTLARFSRRASSQLDG
ncbi:MAG: Pr6Pr family membrane protein [Ktedonobacteraceae bacterium]|nr:Pr6Pr family membrane protein [Ktedonobacteraceae bacterium]